MDIIKIKDCVKIYNENKNSAVKALNGLNLNIKKGESVAIMGISGSGKSTLLRIMGCLDNLTSGEYYLDDKDVRNLSQSEIAQARNSKIGFIFQSNGLIDTESVYENVKIPLLFSKKYKFKEMRGVTQRAIDSVGIYDLMRKKVKNLSGGQKQRVAIARALVNNPDIIMADEPTSALDSTTASEIMDIFSAYNKKGKTIIIVTHDQNVANRMSRIVHIVDGKIIEENLPITDDNSKSDLV